MSKTEWKCATSSQKAEAKLCFCIPAAIYPKILPANHLSLAEFTDFALPPPMAAIKDTEVKRFFSMDEPDHINAGTVQRLRYLVMPSTKLIRKLTEVSREAWINGSKSVVYAHLGEKTPTRFPLWTVSFWNATLDMLKLRKPWKDGWLMISRLMHDKHSKEARELAQQAHAVLTALPWGVKKGGLSDTEPIHSLWRVLGPYWMTGSLQNDLIHILKQQVSTAPSISERFRVENTSFTYSLHNAFSRRNEALSYEEDPSLQWIRVIGDDMVREKKTLVTVAHLGNVTATANDHWVAVVVDFELRCLEYGDSLGNPVPAELLHMFQWWLSRHTAVDNPVSFEVKELPITSQKDSHSCGILSSNALGHRILLDEIALLPQDNVRLERLRVFNHMAFLTMEKMATEDFGEAEHIEDEPDDDDSELETSKRSHDHPNAPTPAPSPTKKRIRSSPVSTPMSLPLPALSFTPKHCVDDPTSTADDVFIVQAPAASKDETSSSSQLSTLTEKTASSRHQSWVKVEGRQTDITGYMRNINAEEKAERVSKEIEALRERREERIAAEHRYKQEKENRVREQTRERVQRHRARQKEEKEGSEGPFLGLNDFDTSQKSNNHSIAEASRPRREFKEDQRCKKKSSAGRKKINEAKEAILTNWFQPTIWSQVEAAAIKVGRPWRPSAIVRELHRMNIQLFKRLTEQVVGRWIDKEAKARGESKWKDAVLAKVEKGNRPGGQSTRSGILDAFPETRDKIIQYLDSLRAIGVPLTLVTIRAIMIAYIDSDHPSLFENTVSDGSKFKCSDTFVRKFLASNGWTERRATRAAQKLPAGHERILKEAYLREAYIIAEHNIPAELRVNTDQTQLIYQHGTKQTWNRKGAKQVDTKGQDEKRAFTLVPSISASGELLPFQAVYDGKTAGSCPKKSAAHYREASKLGFRFDPSGKEGNYWSSHETMHSLVDGIIAPYFEKKKKELNLPQTQRSIWKIDCWSVHKSAEFRGWMRSRHPTIILVFIPGGCTGLWQPLDVGIQRPLKGSMKRTAHRDIVEEVSAQLRANSGDVRMDTTKGTLRDRSVAWLVKAYEDINRKDLILKAFSLCRVGTYDCSHESLTSATTVQELLRLPKENPALYEELTLSTDSTVAASAEEPAYGEEMDDDTSIPVPDIVEHIITEGRALNANARVEMGEEGRLERAGAAEAVDIDEEAIQRVVEAEFEGDDPLVVHGPRKRRKPARFGGNAVWEEG